MDLVPLIKEILTAKTMVIATSKNDIPWAAEVIFTSDEDFNLYWVSDEGAQHSKNIQANPQVAITVTLSNENKKEKALQIQADVLKLEKDKVKQVARQYFEKMGEPVPSNLDEIANRTKHRTWYKAVPSKIYVIYGKLFGYDRKEHRSKKPGV